MKLDQILRELKCKLRSVQKINVDEESPPPEGSKNEVFKFRLVNNIVIAPARTGRDNSSRIVEMRIDQTNRGILSRDIDVRCIFKIIINKINCP